MIDPKRLAAHPAAKRAEAILRGLRLAPVPGVNPLVQLAVWASQRSGVREELAEQAAGLLSRSPALGVSLLVDSFEELEADDDQSGANPQEVLEGHLDRLEVSADRLLENLDQNLRHVYPSFGPRSQ